ncbi:MAG: arginine--tRNA ligase [Gammaproteobacteria bacterium]|nr:MAG: arginine--tRNA ligase [Gammaproteobacteria bacterium]
MKPHIRELIESALATLREQGVLPDDAKPEIRVDHTREKSHGDLASNVALMLARQAKINPRQLAEKIITALPKTEHVAKVEVAGPGFINFHLREGARQAVVRTVLEQGNRFGCFDRDEPHRILLEFVSANPNGPLHVGHGRIAAYGDSLVRLLIAAGNEVHTEYYVNDAGRQMDILAASVWFRYLDLCGEQLPFPANGYHGDYVWDIGASLHRENGDTFLHAAGDILKDLPADEPDGGDKDLYVDALIERAQALLGGERYQRVHQQGLKEILRNIEQDLKEFGVEYDEWFLESSLTGTGAVDHAIDTLSKHDDLYEQDGALWFRSSQYGDDKDRVVRRDNGQITYFASDIAYHLNKLERGYDTLIDIWGADHHGYVSRVKAAIDALGGNPETLTVRLVQFVVLYREGRQVQMSTRSGEFVPLRELRNEVGNDAARFFYVMRKSEAHLDFDLDLAKSQSQDNPVYYVQYAHARVASVMAQLRDKGLARDEAKGFDHLHLLTEEHEEQLLMLLSRYPELITAAAGNYEPHQITWYLRELAQAFHTYYNAHQFLVESDTLRDARLNLILAVQQVIRNGLSIIGVNAPESM